MASKAGNGAAMTAKQKKAFKKEVVEAAQQAIMVGMKRAAEAGQQVLDSGLERRRHQRHQDFAP